MVVVSDATEQLVEALGVLPEMALLFNSLLVFVDLFHLFIGFVFYQNNGWCWLPGICMTRKSTIKRRSIER